MFPRVELCVIVMVSSLISACEQFLSAVLGSIGIPNIASGSEGVDVTVNFKF